MVLKYLRREKLTKWKEPLRMHTTVSSREVKDIIWGEVFKQKCESTKCRQNSAEPGHWRTGRWAPRPMPWSHSKRPRCPESWLRRWTAIETKALLYFAIVPTSWCHNHKIIDKVNLKKMSLCDFISEFPFPVLRWRLQSISSWSSHAGLITFTLLGPNTWQKHCKGRRAYSGSQFQRDFSQSWQGKQRGAPLSAVLQWDPGRFTWQPTRKGGAQVEPGLPPAT